MGVYVPAARSLPFKNSEIRLYSATNTIHFSSLPSSAEACTNLWLYHW